MEFRILGPLQVVDGDGPVEIAGTKRRAVLALLVLRANEVVRSELLIDELWGEQAPRNAAAALHNHVSRLRKVLGPEMLARREWGYVLRAAPGSIDLQRFEALVEEADQLPARERSEKLREALALWRGQPLADLGLEPALQGDIARLEELRLSTFEQRIDADLEAGGSSELVGELETLIAENPLREHLRWQLILALYRAGRQAEALEVYRETRRVLDEELGLDPSPALRDLERAILRQDPSLVVAPSSRPGARSPAEPPPAARRRIYAGLVALAALVGAGAVAGATLWRGGSPAAVPTRTVRTIVETVRNSVTTVREQVPAAGARKRVTRAQTVATRSTKSSVPVTHPVSHTRSEVSRETPLSSTKQVVHRVKHVKKKTTTTTTTTIATTEPVRIADDFASPTMNGTTWSTWSWGTGATAQQGDGQLDVGIPANAHFDAQYNVVSASYAMKCRFLGDFDARVDYKLLDWPTSNGASVSFTAGTPEWTWILSRSGDSYSSWPNGVSAQTSDTAGTLRLARSHNLLKMFFWHAGQWRQVGETNLRGEVRLQIGLSANSANWQQTDVTAAFDNFAVTAPDADCPSGSDPRG